MSSLKKDLAELPVLRMPAEWEPHAATWIAWPHEQSDWPGKPGVVCWVYAEIVRALSISEPVEILVHNEEVKREAEECLEKSEVSAEAYRLHLIPNDRSWLRDSGPTAVQTTAGEITWLNWRFNAWAKYDNYSKDEAVPEAVARITGVSYAQPRRGDTNDRFVLEGGAIDTDGEGALLVTEECLLSSEQERNPNLSREGYEELFGRYLGIRKTIWLERGILGDDTHGHIDDLARFVGPAKVVLVYPTDPGDPNFRLCENAYDRLSATTDAKGRRLEIVKLPFPKERSFEGQLLPASYANFYIGNKVVLVPTFNDANDFEALKVLRELFPERSVIGINCSDLILGLGTLHCLTQQQPLERLR